MRLILTTLVTLTLLLAGCRPPEPPEPSRGIGILTDPTATRTAVPLTCSGFPDTGTGILRAPGGTVLETVVYISSAGKSFGAVNWMTPPAASTRVWATGTPNPGTAATAVP